MSDDNLPVQVDSEEVVDRFYDKRQEKVKSGVERDSLFKITTNTGGSTPDEMLEDVEEDTELEIQPVPGKIENPGEFMYMINKLEDGDWAINDFIQTEEYTEHLETFREVDQELREEGLEPVWVAYTSQKGNSILEAVEQYEENGLPVEIVLNDEEEGHYATAFYNAEEQVFEPTTSEMNPDRFTHYEADKKFGAIYRALDKADALDEPYKVEE